MATKKRDKELMTNYITQKALLSSDLEEHKVTKKELMLKAGYTLDSATKNNLENTKLYAQITSEMINSTGFVLTEFLNVLVERVKSGEINRMRIQDIIKATKVIVDIHKGLSPSYKQKVSTKDADGTVKNVWTKIN